MINFSITFFLYRNFIFFLADQDLLFLFQGLHKQALWVIACKAPADCSASQNFHLFQHHNICRDYVRTKFTVSWTLGIGLLLLGLVISTILRNFSAEAKISAFDSRSCRFHFLAFDRRMKFHSVILSFFTSPLTNS